MDAAEILKMAVGKEAEAYDLYCATADRTDNPAARALLRELAAEEAQHRDLLQGLTPQQAASFRPPQARDLKIAQYLAPKPLALDSSLQDVLVHAMKREEEAMAFYLTMAELAAQDDLRVLLEGLSEMENSHKARLEAFYEDVFMQEM